MKKLTIRQIKAGLMVKDPDGKVWDVVSRVYGEVMLGDPKEPGNWKAIKTVSAYEIQQNYQRVSPTK